MGVLCCYHTQNQVADNRHPHGPSEITTNNSEETSASQGPRRCLRTSTRGLSTEHKPPSEINAREEGPAEAGRWRPRAPREEITGRLGEPDSKSVYSSRRGRRRRRSDGRAGLCEKRAGLRRGPGRARGAKGQPSKQSSVERAACQHRRRGRCNLCPEVRPREAGRGQH